jgi:hypothetical protein
MPIFAFFILCTINVYGGEVMSGRRSGDRRTSQSRSIVDNFRRGNKIQVFSAGRQLDGNGTFFLMKKLLFNRNKRVKIFICYAP